LEVRVQAGDRSTAEQRPAPPIWSQAVERFPAADRVLSTILTRQAARYRGRTLFVFGETRWSYAETASIAAASAARLIQAGIRAGERLITSGQEHATPGKRIRTTAHEGHLASVP